MKLLFIFTSLFIIGCGYDNTRLPIRPEQNKGANQSPKAELDFATIRTQVFEPHCLSCHSDEGGNPKGVNLETYARAKPRLARSLIRVQAGTMPLAGPLDEATQALLARWIEIGAPEFSNSATSPTATRTQSCEDHLVLANAGLRQNLDENNFFDTLSNTLHKRHDDCEERNLL